MGYEGRYVQAMKTANFGGIDKASSIVNIGENAAWDITNFDIGLDGAITRRKGYSSLSTIGDYAQPKAVGFWPFMDSDGTWRYGAIAKDASGVLRMYDSASPSGPWTQRGTTSYTELDPQNFVGISWHGNLICVNGTDAPTMLTFGSACGTLKDLSLLDRPVSGTFTTTATGTVATGKNGYGVTAITPRGETIVREIYVAASGAPSWYHTAYDATGVTGINGVDKYITLYWAPVASAEYYGIYLYYNTAGTSYANRDTYIFPATSPSLVKIAQVPGNITSYVDGGSQILNILGTTTPSFPIYAPSSNTAYNTPASWESGYPTGGMVVARGRDERLFLWRGNTIWASALGDALWWFNLPGATDAFVFTLNGGIDNRIVAGANLNDYLIFWSKTDCFVFTGTSGGSIDLVKIIPVGCVSPHSVQIIGTDIYLWSQFGPTSFKRILSGADIAVNQKWNNRIKPILDTSTNKDQWERIASYADIIKNRVVWSVPATGASVNSIGIVYQYDVDGFTKYDNWGFHHAYSVNYNVFALRDATTNSICQLHITNQDAGVNINASYYTSWFDWGTWEMRKRIVWTDLLADRQNGSYSFSFSWSFDYDRFVGDPIVCTETTTDGSTIDTTSGKVTHHKAPVYGIGNAIQLRFTATGGDEVVKLVGWRPDARNRGVRVV